MCGIKVPQQEFVLKMQGGAYARGGGGAYLRDTTVFQSTEATLVQRPGHPCCQVLEEYKHINILSSFDRKIKTPEEHSHLEVIPIRDIQGRAVYVQLDNSPYNYVLKQPNTHDHNILMYMYSADFLI